jgi:hypothetical protein
MGREEAAIAVAIVSAKPAGHFHSSPRGYFHGMMVKAKAGELNLDRTIWGLRARLQRIEEGGPRVRPIGGRARPPSASSRSIGGSRMEGMSLKGALSAYRSPPRPIPPDRVRHARRR